MMKPTIHLNGTSADELLRQLAEATDAIRLAMITLANAAPNGRDYYPQGNAAIFSAQREHEARMAALRAVLMDLETIAEHVADARDARRMP